MLKNLTLEERKFVETYCFYNDGLYVYDAIAQIIEIDLKKLSELYDQTKKVIQKIQKIKEKYNRIKNKVDKNNQNLNRFESFRDFFEWYTSQKQECCYCKISKDNLKKLFDLNILSSKKFNGTLHIERFDSSKQYSRDNCGLACAVCNNAKSDFISQNDFEEFFVDAVQQYFQKKLQI